MKGLLFVLLSVLPLTVSARLESVRAKIDELTAGKRLKVGIALCDSATGDRLSLHGNDLFPMQSVFKLPIALLRLFDSGRLLCPATQKFLRETMAATETGSVRWQLPPEAVVIHKTGFAGRDGKGIAAATNDAGLPIRPECRRIAYTVFITESAEPDAVNYGIIADPAQIL